MSFSSQFFSFQWSNFYSFVPEALWCCSLRPTTRSAKIMFFSILIQLTGVLCTLFKFLSSYQVLHLFSTGVPPKFWHSCSLAISWYRCVSIFLSFVKPLFHVFATFKVLQCSLFLFANGVFAILFISIVLFLSICSTSQGSMVSLICLTRVSSKCFHSFVCFIPSSSVFSPVPSLILGQDPLVVVECCNAPRPTL